MTHSTAAQQTPVLKFGDKLKFSLICRLAYSFFRLMHFSYRYRYFGLNSIESARKMTANGGYILALWHENAFVGVSAHSGQPIVPLISQSKDGEIMNFIQTRIGFLPVRGSSSRSGSEAKDEMTLRAEQGNSLAITIDGPKGPRRQSKNGVLAIAKNSGVPIVPMIALGEKSWIFAKSWDKFRLPKPFTKVAVVYGAPIFVESSIEGEQFEACRVRLNSAVTALEEQAIACFFKWKSGTKLPKR
jgi:lysophospholipid acyltransferase (LPLAT)-like uncharacterized protein